MAIWLWNKLQFQLTTHIKDNRKAITICAYFQRSTVRFRLRNWFSKSTLERRAGLGSSAMINASGTKHKDALVVRGCVVSTPFLEEKKSPLLCLVEAKLWRPECLEKKWNHSCIISMCFLTVCVFVCACLSVCVVALFVLKPKQLLCLKATGSFCFWAEYQFSFCLLWMGLRGASSRGLAAAFVGH